VAEPGGPCQFVRIRPAIRDLLFVAFKESKAALFEGSPGLISLDRREPWPEQIDDPDDLTLPVRAKPILREPRESVPSREDVRAVDRSCIDGLSEALQDTRICLTDRDTGISATRGIGAGAL